MPVDRKPKPCNCKRANHTHGTRGAYIYDNCRCYQCSNASAESKKAYKRGEFWREGLVHICGPRRRLRALATIGYDSTTIANLIGCEEITIRRIRGRAENRNVHKYLADEIAALYRAKISHPVLTSKGRRTARLARSKYWEAPMDWGDQDLDDPNAMPDIKYEILTKEQLEEYLSAWPKGRAA